MAADPQNAAGGDDEAVDLLVLGSIRAVEAWPILPSSLP
jgi:hypothetical protein